LAVETDVADAKRGDALDVVLFGGAAHRVAVAVADAVAHVDEIQVGVDLDDMDRAARKGADAGDVDRMVAAQDDRERPRVQNGADAGFDVGVAFLGVGMDDVGVADVDDADAGSR
jgi:hypothetical protein